MVKKAIKSPAQCMNTTFQDHTVSACWTKHFIPLQKVFLFSFYEMQIIISVFLFFFLMLRLTIDPFLLSYIKACQWAHIFPLNPVIKSL